MEFDWDAGNLDHIAEHDVTQEEAEAAFFGFRVTIKAQAVDRELRRRFVAAVGGRILLVVYTLRDGQIRVVTVFNAEDWMVELFEARRGR